LPYAREAAELLLGGDEVRAAATPSDAAAAVRRRHFELRARSLDDALDRIPGASVLELAAGYSMRGLARAARVDVDYLDTDLAPVVERKRAVVARLAPPALAGRLRVEPLDALDADAFAATVASLRPGPVTIVQEGLLMYLDRNDKARLARSIRAAIAAHGGAWITADIYLRSSGDVRREPEVERFLAEHRVEDHKFGSWGEAEAFFQEEGFAIAHRLTPRDDRALVRETWIVIVR
jgi:O-methyltransferase involved in polyketide biosynthesis